MFDNHRNILDYSLKSFKRKRLKNLGTMAVFIVVVFVLASEIFLFSALEGEAKATLTFAPDITVQKLTAGRQDLIPMDYSTKIMEINGVSRVQPRVWGFYYDANTGATFTLMGVDFDTTGLTDDLALTLEDGSAPQKGEVIVGKALADLVDLEVGDKLLIVDSRGDYVKFRIVGIFSSGSSLQTSDVIVMDIQDARAFFGIPSAYANDLTVQISNPAVRDVVVKKITEALPDSRVLPREAIARTYDSIFGWRSGFFLAAMIGMILAFAIMSFDRMSGITAEERKEVGILKATGWTTSDILELKALEGLVISINSFIVGVMLAYVHVFYLGATVLKPILIGWSVLYPDFDLIPYINLNQILLIFFISVIPFMAAIIIPSWKTAVTDPDVALRGI